MFSFEPHLAPRLMVKLSSDGSSVVFDMRAWSGNGAHHENLLNILVRERIQNHFQNLLSEQISEDKNGSNF